MFTKIIQILKERLTWRWLLLIVVIIFAVYSFLNLTEEIWLEDGVSWDVPVVQRISEFHTPTLDFTFKAITNSAGSMILISMTIIALWFWYKKMYSQIAMLIVSVLGMGIITDTLKWLIQRPRQDIFQALVVEESYSFPSGHTGAAVALFGLAGIYLWQSEQYLLGILSWFWVFLVMLSRVYLGAHYPSDVIASLTLGIVWLALLTNQLVAKRLHLN